VQLAERWRQTLEETPLALPDGRTLVATVSIGAASAGASSQRPDDVVRAADGALYAAKENGRNRVETSPAGEDEVWLRER
jgi:diguanylate cyclase (GGDEF)-like protein